MVHYIFPSVSFFNILNVREVVSAGILAMEPTILLSGSSV